MTGVNHIAGGLVFTGVFSSFWNVNIFSKPAYLGLCVLASVLPDIDHTQSLVGKLFYPLARYLDRHFGHRTITHSLLLFILLILLSSAFEKLYSDKLHLTLIVTFSYASHLLLDMMTKAGVPLFYPFSKNPCVIPGNPALRLKSGDFKTEVTIFCLLISMGLSCKPLFENGFWTTFNRAFGTFKHLHHEFITSAKLLELAYDCSYQGKDYQGKGYLVQATRQQAIVFNAGFFEINQYFQTRLLLPTKTELNYQTQELSIHDIAPDSLLALIHNKPLLALHIQSNTPIDYMKDHKPYTSTQVELAYSYNPLLRWPSAHTDQEVASKIELLEYELQTLQRASALLEEKQHTINERITELTYRVDQMDAYSRQQATEELKELRKELAKLANHRLVDQLDLLAWRLEQLRRRGKPLCRGYIQYLVLPEASMGLSKG